MSDAAEARCHTPSVSGYVFAAVTLLLVGGVVGGLVSVGVDTAAVPSSVVESVTTDLPTETEDPTVGYFLVRNGSIAVLLCLGAVTFGAGTVLILLVNGFFLGFQITGAAAGTDLLVLAVTLVPHGVFELPGLVSAGAAGLVVPGELIRYLVGRRESVPGATAARQSLKFAAVGLLGIGVAAVVEATVTPVLLDAVA